MADADRFFGRESLTAELVAYRKDHRFLAVVGASGSGKSSVVRAGVVPALQKGEGIKGSDKWLVIIVTPTAKPLDSLAVALTKNSESVTAAATLVDDMAKDTRSLGLYARRLTTGPDAPQHIVLVIDQFEELFTLCKDNAERKAFVDNLLTASQEDGVATVVLTLRADFYAHCAQFDNLRLALQESQKYIGPMSEDELRAAIENPAAKGGWDLEPGLTNRLLKDVSDQPGSLPLLSHALLETWKRRSGRMLTLAGYEASGGVQGAIAHTADDVYGALSPEQQALVRNVFVRLTSLGEGVQDTRRRVRLDELMSGVQGPQMEVVLKRLEDARLVTAEKQQMVAADGSEQITVFVDVVHEALIRQWPLLRKWLDDDRDGLRIHRRLTEASDEWEALQHDSGSLFRGALLAQTAEWAKAHDGDLNDRERAFLDASREQVDAEQREKERIEVEREETRQRELVQTKLLAAEAEARLQAEAKRAEEQAASQQRETAQAKQYGAQLRQRAWYLTGALALAVGVAAVALGLLGLAQTQLARQEGTKLLQDTITLAASGKFTDAIATYDRAIVADPTLPVKAEDAITGTIRIEATKLITEGEELARSGDHEGASEKFRQALALNPPSDTPVYVWIEPGEFLMGSTDEQIAEAVRLCPGQGTCNASTFANEQPIHTGQLDGYWMLRTEVTNEQYRRCVDAGACTEPSDSKWNKAQFGHQPVTDVDWHQAKTYAEWVGGRLPTEAQWEHACRGSDGRIYPWGSDPASPERANYADSGLNGPIDVGSYPPGVNGLHDMAGNVYEWTSSQHMKGGSFNNSAGGVRCAYWYQIIVTYGDIYEGKPAKPKRRASSAMAEQRPFKQVGEGDF